LFEEKYL
jgi:hypothetical protein